MPKAKRQRTSSPDNVPPEQPIITAADIDRIPFPTCHDLIHKILLAHPGTATLILSYIPPPPPPKPKRPINFEHYIDLFQLEIEASHPYRAIADTAERVGEELMNFANTIVGACAESDHYETLASGFETLVKIGQNLSETGNEQVTYTMLVEGAGDVLADALTGLHVIAEEKGWEAQLKNDLWREVRTLHWMFRDRDVVGDAFEELADAFGIVEGETSDEDEE